MPSTYTKKPQEEDINILYTYPTYKYNATPPPLNGLRTLHYFNDHYNFYSSFEYDALQFNTNYDNMNREAYVGPIATINTTTSKPKKEYKTIITKHSVTYVTTTEDITVVTNINRLSGEIVTNTYVTGTEVIPDDYDEDEPESFRRIITFGATITTSTEEGNVQYNSDGTIVNNDDTSTGY